MALLRTPSRGGIGVKTRSQAASEQLANREQRDPMLVSKENSRKSEGTERSSAAARRKLEFEAAQKQAAIELQLAQNKASIEKDLVAKKLELELAELDELELERSSSRGLSKVDEWLVKQSGIIETHHELTTHSHPQDIGNGCTPLGGDARYDHADQTYYLAGGDHTPRADVNRIPHAGGDRTPRADGNRIPRADGNRIPCAGGDHTPRADGHRTPHAYFNRTARADGNCAPHADGNAHDSSGFREFADVLRQALIPISQRENNRELLARLATSKDLPMFDGDPMQWLQFREAFVESSQLCGYSDAENVWRLRKCLRGDAREAVSALLIGSTTPEDILKTLELRFGRAECLINKIVTQVKKIQPLPMSYHTEIVNFSIKIQNYVTAVKAIKANEYLQSPELMSTVLTKLPPALINKWAEYSYYQQNSSIPKLELLSEFLYREATIIATSGVSYIHGQSEVRKRYEHTRNHTVLTSTFPEDAMHRDDKNEKCKYCRGSPIHALEKCAKFKRAMRRDRWRFARTTRLCFKCLGARHADPASCRAPDCSECGQPHHHLLHWTRPADSAPRRAQSPPPGAAAAARPPDTDDPRHEETVAHTSASNSVSVPKVPKVFLKVVPVTVHGPKDSIHTHALLDDGATVTLIAADLADQAGLHGETTTMRARSAWDSGELVCQAENVSFEITNNDCKRFKLRARKMKELSLPVQPVSTIDFSKYEHLDHNYDLCKCDAQPKLLIGQDNYNLIAPLICIKGKENEPYITKTPLGWCVHGPVHKLTADRFESVSGTRKPTTLCCDCSANIEVSTFDTLHLFIDDCDMGTITPQSPMLLKCDDDDSTQRLRCCDCIELHESVRRSFALDAIGISNKPRQNSDELRAITILNKTCELIDNQWFVGLPWKYDDFVMPDSYQNAINRLKSVERKMAANKAYASRYQDRIQHLFSNNYARKVDEGESGDHVWYLPHFGVDNPNKKKLRLVFDAASKAQGYSLNDFLLQGPDLLQSLFGIMFRFRENQIGVVGDIKDMFLRIKIAEKDQHALRFLYRDDETKNVTKYVMTSLIFGANCSPFVAQFVKNKNASNFEKTFPTAVDAICKQHYMDDYIDSLPDVETAKRLIGEISYVHQQGGFEIRNWASNVPAVLQNVPNEALSDSASCVLNQDSSQSERTLGLLWYPASDELGFDLSLKRIPDDILHLKRKPTKREMLRIIMSIFDIHGFLGPFTIKAKILMQKTWKTDLEWDEELSEDLFIIFAEWMKQLKALKDIRIPRYFFRDRDVPLSPAPESPAVSASETAETPLELHVFCDASPSAYAAVAYWRKRDGDKQLVSFIASKSRVAPTKLVTIPRLELQGALLACRLADTIKKEHRIKPTATFYWTDSTTVLHWIRNESRNYKVFIANRLGEIDELSSIKEWHYVPTDLNVADLATKSRDYELKNNAEWFVGPSFLHDDDTMNWPQEPETERKISDDILETVNIVNEKDDSLYDLPVPEPTRFSSWLRLLRATATVLLFIEKCKKKKINELTDELMQRAEILLFQHSQAKTFRDDILLLKSSKEIKRNSRLRALTPVLDENKLLRVGGRIGAAKDVATNVKSPVILDGREHVARLIVKDYHVRAAHGCNELVVNELRQKYWLLSLRPTVRTIASRCYFCRIRKAMPKPNRLGDLPEARLTHHQRPFTMCGIDLFGPIEVTVGRQKPKRYGVLFTCLTVRAVHLEIVSSLTADALIMALRRMAARRGWPKLIYSDNGTNMRGADVELRKAYAELEKDAITGQALNHGVDWRFIPPASPHMGGAWERLIRSVKTALKVVLKERSPKEEVLLTFLTEVENIINSRPLTHVSVDPRSEETLTPNHFLIGSSSNLPLAGVFDDKDLYLRKQWRASQRLADHFWSRWVKEVLPVLIPRNKWQQEGAQLKIGDLVVVVDPSSPRNCWPKGIIETVYPGADGRVRVVRVKTKSGIFKRAAARVALLNVTS